MSTIVAVKKNNQVCIAADSLTTFGETKLSAQHDPAHDKIIQHADSYIGIVGSAAHQMVLDSALKKIGEEVNLLGRQEIFDTFNKVHPILKESFFLNPKDEDDDAYESSHIDALIVNSSGLFGVFSLREVFEYAQFWAIGSGADFALGAMHALYDKLGTAEAIAQAGVEAGAEFNNATGLPMTLYSIDLPTTPKTVMV
ncbi:MAG TPA: MFS transporter [Chromatiales bacterium]|nr:MFS transporter [Thiotrichales bacterium]HIP68504.1 MFS transporter [Chromatiales bacterium]